jgi:hypothetical protein
MLLAPAPVPAVSTVRFILALIGTGAVIGVFALVGLLIQKRLVGSLPEADRAAYEEESQTGGSWRP